jgi:hypothetical protein
MDTVDVRTTPVGPTQRTAVNAARAEEGIWEKDKLQLHVYRFTDVVLWNCTQHCAWGSGIPQIM